MVMVSAGAWLVQGVVEMQPHQGSRQGANGASLVTTALGWHISGGFLQEFIAVLQLRVTPGSFFENRTLKKNLKKQQQQLHVHSFQSQQ